MGDKFTYSAYLYAKSRVKVYDTDNSPTYYLAKGDTFSIELYNPTNKTVLAKIRLKQNTFHKVG
jgi:hypothetical protein